MADQGLAPPVLSTRELQTVADLPRRRVREVSARHDVISQGDTPTVVNMVLDGWACRYKELRDGRRQILSLFLPTEICDANVFMLRVMDHSVGALTDLTVAEITAADFRAAISDDGRLAHLLWFSELRAISVQREWTANLGMRGARERIAHLLCETFHRLRHLGMTDGDGCDFPLTQVELAEATGLTPVHVNRMLQLLRAAGLIEIGNRRLRVPDLAALEREASFDPTYLHQDLRVR